MNMFTFKIFEIPDGKSNRKLILSETTIDLGEVSLKQAEVALEFENIKIYTCFNGYKCGCKSYL